MANIYPFRAFRYNAEKAGTKLDHLVTQPYDKIDAKLQEKYYGLSPYNLVRLIRGKAEPGDNGRNVYTRAAAWLEEWTQKGVLAQEAQPALYPYFQEYTVPGTEDRRVRKGFIALGRIEDYAAGIVHRHEMTLTGPKKDRLELLRHTRTHFGQIFMIYSDPKGEVDRLLDKVAAAHAPQGVTDDYGARHRLWAVTDAATIKKFRELMAEKKLIIADGHHRYETAMAYRDECRAKTGKSDPEAPHEKVMMTFINMDGPGVTILPTHRVVANLPGFNFEAFRKKASAYFDWYAYPRTEGKGGAARLLRDLAERGAARTSFGVCAAGEPALYLFLLKINVDLAKELPGVSPRQQKLDLVVLHKLLLERCLGLTEDSVRQEKNLHYLRHAEEALAMVEKDEASVAFLVNPIRVEQVREVAFSGETLPQKSTDFYPKLLSGMTIYRLDNP
ncbi:MAG TPA: DUF1015 domain-containing protein [Candidatus Acidoferrales bacterium]|nr:DUF1015 domain-containing protein [Candidatus Acidoferrales bacterium]